VTKTNPTIPYIAVLAFGCAALLKGMCAVAAATSNAEPDQLEEVVVTAQKREQRIQDIPISVDAVSGDSIDRSGARDFHDLLLSIPGVSYSGAEPGQSRYSIRGISTAASSPTVGIYLNDIALLTISTNFSGAADPMLVDIDRVEVLKGPQGTLYGGSAMGGAIKYVTREPVLDRFAVTAEGGIASIDHGGVSYNAESFVNLPLINDKLAIRLGGAYRFDAGYVDNVPGGLALNWTQSTTPYPEPFSPAESSSGSTFASKDDNSRSTTVARASVKWLPTDSLSILPIATIQRSDKANPDTFFPNLPQFEDSARFNEPTRDDLYVYSLNVTQGLGGMSLTSLTGYVDRTLEWDRDYSLFVESLAPIITENTYNESNTTTNTFSQEIRLASSDPQARFKWVLGLFYSHQRDNLFQKNDTPGLGALLGTGTDIPYVGNETTLTSQDAVFTDLTYSLSKQWDVSAGLRWFDIKQKVDGQFNGILNGGPSEVDGKRSTDVGFTPKAAITYRPLDDHLLYGSASKGFRQGGPNRFNTDSPLCAPDFERLGITRVSDSYQPDNLWTYELGSKNEVGERTTVINGAVYYTDWKKIQQQVNLNSCGFQFVGNVGAATVKGAELSAESALGFGVTVGATASYTATRITQSSPGVSAQVGQEVLDTPKWEGSLYGDYQFLKAGGWSGSFRADAQFHGANLRSFDTLQFFTYANGVAGSIPDPTQVQAAYHVFNANFSFSNGPMQYRFYVDNIADATPYLDFSHVAGFTGADTIRPRTVGISVRTTF
jgi:iron complex outermembrane receptor protein